MIKQNYTSILFATAIALAALFVSQALWIGNASRQEMKKQDISFQTCFNQSITTLVNKYMRRERDGLGYNIEPIKDEKISPEQKRKAIDAGNVTDDTNVPLLIENALAVLSIDNHHFRLTNLDSLIRISLNNDENIISHNLILQDIRRDSLLDEVNNASVSNSKLFFAKTYTAERKIETPAKSYLIKAEYLIMQPSYLKKLGIITVVSIIASIIIVIVLFYLLFMLKRRVTEISNMERSFHGAIHDLKSPLAFVFFQLSLLEEDETDMIRKASLSLTADRVDFLTDKIMRLLKSAQNIGKIDEADKTEVSLYDLLEQIESEMHTMFPQKKISFKNQIDADFTIYVLPDLIEASIRIIIENAVKFSEEAPVVIISAFQDVENIKISLADNGVGMSHRQMKNIFKPYFTTDTLKGNGIGLYYAQSIVKAHNGKISVKSEVGKGSEFVITLPNR